ncbi:MAG: cytochrome b/b6 domain-containing protein [Pseudomonadota bacterium]
MVSARDQGPCPHIWSLAQRLIHWGLALGFAIGWWSSERHDTLHAWNGYALTLLVVWRVFLGFGRHPGARWDGFLGRLRRLPDYLRGRLVPGPGLSPSGAASALALLALMLATAVTGWMLTLEAYVGDEAAEARHVWAFNLLAGWIGLHVLAVVAVSLRQRRNRIADMIHGGRARGV